MIQLREMTASDLPLFREWLHAPHVAPWFADALDWLAEVEDRSGDFSWIHHFIAEDDGVPIGFCQYYAVPDSGEVYEGYEDPAGIYSIDYLVGDAKRLRKGFGKQIVHALIERILLHADAKRIILRPEAENAASRALLASCGFTPQADTGIYVMELRQ